MCIRANITIIIKRNAKISELSCSASITGSHLSASRVKSLQSSWTNANIFIY